MPETEAHGIAREATASEVQAAPNLGVDSMAAYESDFDRKVRRIAERLGMDRAQVEAVFDEYEALGRSEAGQDSARNGRQPSGDGMRWR